LHQFERRCPIGADATELSVNIGGGDRKLGEGGRSLLNALATFSARR
jgi:hypothetical protein